MEDGPDSDGDSGGSGELDSPPTDFGDETPTEDSSALKLMLSNGVAVASVLFVSLLYFVV